MLPFLVSFCYTGIRYGPAYGLAHGSHVIYLPEAPSTAQAVLDMQVSIAMEYNLNGVVILGWDLLPDEYTHPSGGRPYSYFIVHSGTFEHTTGLGSLTYLIEEPTCTLDALRFVEETIRSGMQAQEIRLVSCKALREPTPQELQDYEEKRRY